MHDLFLGVPARLGCSGIESILELQLTEVEQNALKRSAESVSLNIQMAYSLLGWVA